MYLRRFNRLGGSAAAGGISSPPGACRLMYWIGVLLSVTVCLECGRHPAMHPSFGRRRFLQGSALASASLLTCSIPLDRSARAAAVQIEVPVVDQVIVREITDNSHDIFLRGGESPGLAVTRTGFPEGPRGK